MAQVSNKISMLSRLAVAVLSNPEQRTPQPTHSGKNSNYITKISAHHQAVAHIR